MTLRVLTVASNYPSVALPHLGLCVEERVRRLQDTGRVEMTVIAPVPWFPSSSAAFGHYATFARIPSHETRNGIHVEHPRFGKIPKKVGKRTQPAFYHAALKSAAARLIEEEGPFDLIDAHYYYPDAVAAGRLAQELGIPMIATAHGDDVTCVPEQSSVAADMMLETAAGAYATITLSESLREAMFDLGADDLKIYTLRNGVDLNQFWPPFGRRAKLKRMFGVPTHAPLVVSVGRLEAHYGHDLTIEAVAALPNVHLRIVGGGSQLDALRQLVRELGVGDRIRVTGPMDYENLPDLYGAADVTVVAASRVGGASTILESLACGTPVVATAVGVIPEYLSSPEAGRLVEDRSVNAIMLGIGKQLVAQADRARVREHARKFAWEETISSILYLFESAVENRSRVSSDELQMRFLETAGANAEIAPPEPAFESQEPEHPTVSRTVRRLALS